MKKLFASLSRPFTALGRFVSNCWTTCPSNYRCGTLAISLLANIIAFVFLFQGCAGTPAGLEKDIRFYEQATNVIAQIQPITNALPAPVGPASNLIFGALTGLLALWNTHNHVQLRRLRNSATSPVPVPVRPKPPVPVTPD